MSTTNRQNRLLVAEDWKRIYQSYQNADFKSYDFDNLRRAMITYLRNNYAEDFNDYIESSEYLALIDLIAFLGQNLSYRIDLNARENFLELAERRESVLRIARMLSYNPKRNKPANGLLRVSTITTTEAVYDNNGTNLSNVTVEWNDSSNPDWFEQMTKILNAALTKRNPIGTPIQSEVVGTVNTNTYKINSSRRAVPVYTFTKTIDGRSLNFEVTSAKIEDGSIVEETPLPGNSLSLLYRDDGAGPGSVNTGFFCHFRQGTLQNADFKIENPSNNQIVSLDVENINNEDLWLYQLDSNGNEQNLWTKVDSVEGNNVVYNSVSKNIRNIYFPQTRLGDRVNLIFSDGTFGALPKGTFRSYYRTSVNAAFTISPRNIRNVTVNVGYISEKGKTESLTLNLELTTTVNNSTESESSEDIKVNAPALYYTQNRMITAEDYSVAPLSASQDIVKVKAVNRVTSGYSRYFDLVDSTGKYSNTNIFSNDGIVYREEYFEKAEFSFNNKTQVEDIIYNTVTPIIRSPEIRNYYYKNFAQVDMTSYNSTYTQVTSETNLSTGFFLNANDNSIYKVGSAYTGGNFKYIQAGSLCKFIAPAGYKFDLKNNNALVSDAVDTANTSSYKWVKIINVLGDGTSNGTGISNNEGTIKLNDTIPTGSVLQKIVPKLSQGLISDISNKAIDLIFAYKNFGLRYDIVSASWKIILNDDLDTVSPFGLGKAGDTSAQNLDASWLILFETTGQKYTITYRNLRYVFESEKETRFFYDSSDKVYDNKTNRIVKDKISVLGINTQPESTSPFTRDYDWEIVKEYKEETGYIDTKKIQVTFFDSDDDGVVDDPDLFVEIVQPSTNLANKFVIQKRSTNIDNVVEWGFIDIAAEGIIILENEAAMQTVTSYENNQLFYFIQTNVFKNLNTLNARLSINNSYRAFVGRKGLKFHYVHAADYNQRIDPSASNIIDVYMLTRNYDVEFGRWLKGLSETKPLPPSTNQMYFDYGKTLNNIKSISDEIVYHPVNYKVLFGTKAEPKLQASIKVVKNEEVVVSDNDIKTRVVSAIDEFFDPENWDFGDTFYWSELSAYITYNLAPDIVSVVIVPSDASLTFGSLYQVNSESNEIFKSGATVGDIEIIDEITADKIKASGSIAYVSSDTTSIQSAAFNGDS